MFQKGIIKVFSVHTQVDLSNGTLENTELILRTDSPSVHTPRQETPSLLEGGRKKSRRFRKGLTTLNLGACGLKSTKEQSKELAVECSKSSQTETVVLTSRYLDQRFEEEFAGAFMDRRGHFMDRRLQGQVAIQLSQASV